MSVLLGYMGNESDRTKCALHIGREAILRAAGGALDGWGIGFYHAGEVLLQKRPKASTSAPGNFLEHIGELKSDLLVAHVHETQPDAPEKPDDRDPFRFRSWLFGYAGAQRGLSEVLLDSIPDFLRRNIRLGRDREILFYLFLTFLHQDGKLEEPDPAPLHIRRSLQKMLTFIDQTLGSRAPRLSDFSMILTNGRVMAATQRNRPLQMMQVGAITDCQLCREPLGPQGREPKRVVHEHLRAAILLSGQEPVPGWDTLPDQSIVTVTHDIATEVAPALEVTSI